ncbi:MAG TPA: ATP-dependent helicase [Planctomycetaceae bacterium]|jgi:superfamily I DNA/RNA helicase|nr:ATP-dependent helicase [Planctomycetaceae bacterium]
MAWSDGLTGRALGIAGSKSSPIRVMAGPGTGKSFALKRRLMRLLEEGANARRILVVTFTRTAAAELVREIQALGVPGCEKIVASTLHAHCFRLLAKQAVFEFSGRTPRPLITLSKAGVLQFEAGPLLEDLNSPDKFGDKRDRTKRLRAFEAQWARLQADEPGYATDPTDEEFHDKLIAWLRFHECMLIGELVPEALNFVKNNPASTAIEGFEHVLVDEYQDLNKAEQVLIDFLSGGGTLAVVGDPDQSIYSFRYAHPEGIEDFHIGHAGTDDHLLDECRRCPRRVVGLADRLIKRNYPAGATPRLNPDAGNPDGDVFIVQWPSLEDEVTGIASLVKKLIDSRGYDPRDILVLCPRRLIGYQIRQKLLAESVPSHSFYHEEALESDEARKALSLLTLTASHRDRVSLRFLLGCQSPNWLRNQYELLRAHCESAGTHPWDALEEVDSGTLNLGRTKEIVSRFRDIKNELGTTRGASVDGLIDRLFPDGQDWAQVLREMALLDLADLKDAGDLLEHLRTKITQPEMPEAGDFVRVMSLHKSKGLTARAVIVCSCIEGLVPFRDEDEPLAEQEKHLREQRRLFYVAITRCTQLLVISSFLTIESKIAFKIGAKTTRRGKVSRTIASQFLGELGPTAPAAILGSTFLASL